MRRWSIIIVAFLSVVVLTVASSSRASRVDSTAPPLTRHDISGLTTKIRISTAHDNERQEEALFEMEWCGPTIEDVRAVAIRDVRAFADKFSVHVAELLLGTIDAPGATLPNSRRLFQTLPAAFIRRSDGASGWCLVAEVPTSEAVGLCSPFLSRAAEVVHRGNRTAASEFLKSAVPPSSSGEIVVEVESGQAVVSRAREWLVELVGKTQRDDELDRVAALAWRNMRNGLSFVLESDGRRGSYSLSFDDAEGDSNNDREVQLVSRIEPLSDIAHLLHFAVSTSLSPTLLAGGEDVQVLLLVRLPRHLVQVDAAEIDYDHSSSRAYSWVEPAKIITANSVEVFRAGGDEVHWHAEAARSWDAVWIRAIFSNAAAVKSLLHMDSDAKLLTLNFALQLRVVVPRLPVEAYAPDLNRLVTLPAALVQVSAVNSKVNAAAPSVLNALRTFTRSRNRVSVYQPGPDRAVPFVALAFALLAISVFLIRTISFVAQG